MKNSNDKSDTAPARWRAGFSLLEMVIVLGIIALIIAAVAGLSHGTREAAKVVATKAEINKVTAKLGAYELLAGDVPTQEQGLRALVERPTSGPVPRRWERMLEGVPKDGWKRELDYRNPGTIVANDPEVRSAGGDGILGSSDDLSSQDHD